MTLVDVDLQYRQNGPNGQVWGSLQCRPSRLQIVDGAYVIPESFTVQYENEPIQITLAELPVGYAWEITFTGTGGTLEWWKYPVGAGPVLLTELPDLDPSTLDPTEEPEAAWWAALAGVIRWTVDPDDPLALIVTFPTFLLDPDNDLILNVPILEGA